MKALTLTQPWATFVAMGVKRIETRDWHTNYRGPLAIHAAKAIPQEVRVLCASGALAGVMQRYGLSLNHLPRGAVLCWCELTDVVRTSGVMCASLLANRGAEERLLGNYTPGRAAWVLGDIRRFTTPIPATGALGLWDWDAPAVDEIPQTVVVP